MNNSTKVATYISKETALAINNEIKKVLTEVKDYFALKTTVEWKIKRSNTLSAPSLFLGLGGPDGCIFYIQKNGVIATRVEGLGRYFLFSFDYLYPVKHASINFEVNDPSLLYLVRKKVLESDLFNSHKEFLTVTV